MGLALRITPRAGDDLTRLRDYIVDRNKLAADRVRSRIECSINILLAHPHTAQLTSKPGVYRSTVPRYGYKLFFAIEDETLVLLHVWHGARDEPNLADL